MKRILCASLIVVGGIILGGCKSNSAATPTVQQPPTAAITASPTLKASPTVQVAEDPEVKAIESDFNKLDTEKNFPTFTDKDLQQ